MKKMFYFNVFKELVKADLVVFREIIFDKCIDLSIWVILTVLVMAYIMPYFGLSNNFGVFQLGGVIAGVGLFELYRNIVDLIVDFEGDRIINYYLTLPLPSWLVILSKATYFALTSFILSLFMIPVGKLVLWNQLNLATISYPKLLLACMCASLFYGCFALFAASLISGMSKIGRVWARFIFPMWFMGGFQFSWTALHHVLPTVAFMILVNPIIYITESVRTAILGQENYINFWLCLSVLLLCTVGFFALGIRNLKKKLDYV
ncbi:MAG: ABC-2 type transporter [Candidatus Dependentiae bacterium ADurb.Bin331]|nr:MAG: ABC-2 type transporter [Candidatus Dependentiae bacterium ADurb.Bin331]